MTRIPGNWRGLRISCCFAVALAILTGMLGGPASQNPTVVHAAQPAKPNPKAVGMCSASKQPNIAAVVNAIANNGNGPFVTDFNVLSEAAWCTFMWLNWPQKANAKVGECLNRAGGQTCEVRWEQWLPSTSVYCSDGSAPHPKTGCGNSKKTAIRMLRAGVNPGARGTEDVGPGAASPGAASLGPAQPTGFVLPDKNNTSTNPSVIFYESVEEPSLVQFLINKKLYNLDGQQAFYNSLNLKGSAGTAGLPPPAGLPSGQAATPIDFPPTAFELKPSWYVSTTNEVQSFGMINAQGTAPFKITNCPTANTPCPIGLTGFHIIWKVFPKSPWFWATFEFDNNAQPPVTNFTIAPMLSAAQPNASLPSNTNVSKGPYVPYDSSTETDPMSVAAAAATAQFKKMLANTYLANYRLVGVQVAPTTDGTPTGPTSYLANYHLETDFGAIKIGTAAVNRSSSCITCHYNASIGSTNTEPVVKGNGSGCRYGSGGKYESGAAYFRRVPIYLRNQDAVGPLFSNKNGLGPCAAYNDANNNPAGYTGPFKPAVYVHQCESKGSFVSGDFVWSLQEAQWASPTKGCRPTGPPYIGK